MALNDYINIRLAPTEKAELNNLARQAGRSRSNVARALLLAAIRDPNYYRRLLGELPQAGTQPATEQPR